MYGDDDDEDDEDDEDAYYISISKEPDGSYRVKQYDNEKDFTDDELIEIVRE